MGKKSGSEIRTMDEQPGSYFRELRKHFLGLKYLNSLMLIRDPESGIDTVRIRDGKKRIWDPEHINIRDPQH
jgi:hypothetical protein